MRHAVLGAGNLGLDLVAELKRRGHTASLFSRSNGFRVENSLELMSVLKSQAFDAIWYCIGGGSVAEAKANPVESRRSLVSLPMLVAKGAGDDKRLVFFSSDYAADEMDPRSVATQASPPLSHYAELKMELETKLLERNRPLTAIIRVGSLVGRHKPEGTFPAKVLANYGFNDWTIKLPENYVTPTPTMWLAGKLVGNFAELFHVKRALRHHCAPSGCISVKDWASFILHGLRAAEHYSPKRFFDNDRPRMSNLDCSFLGTVEHWGAVWEHYFRRIDFVPRAQLADYASRFPEDVVLPGGLPSGAAAGLAGSSLGDDGV